MSFSYHCYNCDNRFNSSQVSYSCPKCDGLVLIETITEIVKKLFSKKFQPDSFWDFRAILPKIDDQFIVSLGEGGTPCRRSKRLGKIWNIDGLYFKDETQNPTNSFKDRAAALLVSHAQSLKKNKIICASNGNQGASIAAYASLEGMECTNIIPKKIDVGKKAQMIAYNSKIIENGDYVDEAIEEAIKSKYREYYQATPEFNPLTIEAQKTISYEIFQQVGPIEGIIVPMGSGGLLLSIWKGFKELREGGIIKSLPKMIGVQSQASSPIVNQMEQIEEILNKPIKKGFNSYALGILVKKPFYQDLALKAIKYSNGMAISIPENIMLTSAEELASNEGIFAEPASALTVGALNILREENKIRTNEKIVCMITGSGLKTPHVLEALSSRAKTAGLGGILSTKLKILSQISISHKNGIYGKKIGEILGGISLAAVYQHLKELEERELIKRQKKGKSVYYRITEKGKKVLEALETLITLL
jgi:threonine synthase